MTPTQSTVGRELGTDVLYSSDDSLPATAVLRTAGMIIDCIRATIPSQQQRQLTSRTTIRYCIRATIPSQQQPPTVGTNATLDCIRATIPSQQQPAACLLHELADCIRATIPSQQQHLAKGCSATHRLYSSDDSLPATAKQALNQNRQHCIRATIPSQQQRHGGAGFVHRHCIRATIPSQQQHCIVSYR